MLPGLAESLPSPVVVNGNATCRVSCNMRW